MISRRDVLAGGAASGILFCSCTMLDRARAQNAAPRRLPVMGLDRPVLAGWGQASALARPPPVRNNVA